MLSVPGVRERFIERARAVPADILNFDLEDSVAEAEKVKARAMVAEAIRDFPAKGRLIYVRINGLSTPHAELDLEAVVGPWLNGINLPKADGADDIEQLDHYLTYLEKVRGIPPGQITIIPWIETTTGLSRAYEICHASPRLIGAALGGEDFVTSLGVRRTRGGVELEYPRAQVAIAARAADLVPIDAPEADFRDLVHFERDITHARGLGFKGKFCIHPTQVEIANRVFAPSPEELTWARQVVDAYEEGERQGHGAVALDGQMIDRPIVLRAHELLDWQQQVEEQEAALR
ncbi:MAG: CoA ester lyase [Chloroflexi bacterium]|nr:CoA ester lyase [Chloroflexota bacterium]